MNSDGDSLGSQLALTLLLEQLGKTVYNINPSHVPHNFRFLPQADSIRVFQPVRDEQLLSEADVLFILDSNSPYRLRGMEEALMHSPAIKVVIDHHQDPAQFASVYVIDTNACSTAELIYRLLIRLEQHDRREYLTRPLAEALYTGIMTDTGNFRFPRTTAAVHRIIARLIEAGVEPYYIFDCVYNQNSMNRAHLLGKALSYLQTFHNGAMCIMTVTQAMMQDTHTTPDDTEGFVEQTLSLRGVRIGILLVELSHEIKISIRSKGTIPAHTIAHFFGGGGHYNAAGCRAAAMNLQQVRDTLIHLVQDYLFATNHHEHAH